MQIVFSFDTEDYVDPVSNDALLSLAESHTRHGIPACFGLVGEKARFLRTCGRRDVIDAVARHEVGYHSDHHFMLPDPDYAPEYVPEYVEKQPWDRAVARLLAEESRGVHDVAEIVGTHPVTWLRNYGDWAPQYLATFAQLGVPVFAYGPPSHNQDPMPIWYCNQLVIANPRLMYENNLHREDMTAQEKLDAHKTNLLEHLEGGTERLGFVTHPTRFIADTWWEFPNWMDNVDAPPRGSWIVPERFGADKIKELLWIADEFLKFVSGLDDVEPLTFRDFWAACRKRRAWLTRGEIMQLAQQQPDESITFRKLDGDAVSPAELFAGFAFALAAPDVDSVPVRHALGPVEEPAETAALQHVPRDTFVDACRRVEFGMQDKPRVPARIEVGGTAVGPGSFLVAMARALREPAAETVTLAPTPNLPEPLHPDDYERLGTGRPAAYMQKRTTFEFPNICRASQLQYWTVKPAAGA